MVEASLPSLLSALDDSLQRDAVCLELRSSLKKLMEQATSPLSAIRQEAWAGMLALLERALADGTQSALRLDALLCALRLEWPLLLTRLHEALGAAPPPAAAAPAALLAAAVSRPPSAGELARAVQLLQICCLLHPPARLDCTSLLLKTHCPPGFLAFCGGGGVERMAALLLEKSTPDRVRARAVRALNLLLNQLAPALLSSDAAPAGATTPAAGAAATAPPPPGLDEEGAAVWAALAGAREALGAALGREARSMLLKRISLDDPQAEARFEQLAHAMQLFTDE
eukprot:scaffold40.g5160.t1